MRLSLSTEFIGKKVPKQHPVGVNNKNRKNYLSAADKYIAANDNNKILDVEVKCKG